MKVLLLFCLGFQEVGNYRMQITKKENGDFEINFKKDSLAEGLNHIEQIFDVDGEEWLLLGCIEIDKDKIIFSDIRMKPNYEYIIKHVKPFAYKASKMGISSMRESIDE